MGHRYYVHHSSKNSNGFKATPVLQSSSVAGVSLQPRANISPNFNVADASTYINFYSSTCYHGHIYLLSLIFPYSLPTSFCSSRLLQLATDSFYQGILMLAEPQMETGIWNHSLTNSPSSPLPSCHHLAVLPSNKSSSSTPCLGKLLLLTPLESPKRGSRDYSSVGLHSKVTKEAVITEQRFKCI